MLFPALFILVMDPLLRQLQASGVGFTVNNFYAAGFLHADDLRMLATSEESLDCQVVLVKVFGEKNLLKLNVSKCEIILFSSQKSIAFPVCEVEGSVMPAGDVVKCLGYWWRGDLSASTSIDEKIRKARRALFLFGSIGVFLGDVSPLSSRAAQHLCGMLVILFVCEN